MEVNSSVNRTISAQSSILNSAPNQNKPASGFAASIREGDTLQAVAHDPSQFDIRPISEAPLQHYVNVGRYGSAGGIVSTNDPNPKLINAEKDQHKLVSNEYSERNVALYKAQMAEQANLHITQATVSVGGTLVGVGTTAGEVATPFNGAQDQQLMTQAKALLAESNGDFSTFIGKLKAVFGDQVSVQQFAEGEGPTFAQTHQMLNGTSFDDFVTEQASTMIDTIATKEAMSHALAIEQAFKVQSHSTNAMKTTEQINNSVQAYSQISDRS